MRAPVAARAQSSREIQLCLAEPSGIKKYEKRGCALGELLPCSGNVYDTNCPMRHVLNVIVDKWAALIVGLLGRQTMRFTELHRQIGGISQKMLTQTLRHLERDGLVQRTVYAEAPPRVEYALTPLGRSLRELIAPIPRHAQ
jgi:DNA-binding HxlR family transcriptional regulator